MGEVEEMGSGRVWEGGGASVVHSKSQIPQTCLSDFAPSSWLVVVALAHDLSESLITSSSALSSPTCFQDLHPPSSYLIRYRDLD